MMRFDQLLHETVEEMATEVKGPSAAFVSVAMSRGRRIYRRRLLTVAGGAVLACTVIVLPWTLVSRSAGTSLTGPTAATSAALTGSPAVTGGPGGQGFPVLAGGWVVTAVGNRVLDRAGGDFVSVEGNGAVLPAPVGNRVLIEAPPDLLQVTGVRGTQPVTVDTAGLGGDYRWSPRGDQLVGLVSQKEPFKLGFAVIDAQTGVVSKHWIDHNQFDCSQCSFSWTRDGREVVVAIADRSGGEREEKVKRLQLFDAASGVPTRSVPITAMPSGPFSWSPSGRYVVADADVLGRKWQLVDLSTGQSRPFPYDAVWATDDQLLVANNGKVLTLRPDGTVIGTAVVDITGADNGISLGPPA